MQARVVWIDKFPRLQWLINGSNVSYIGHELALKIYFEKRDIWIGLYWTKNVAEDLYLYFCLVPFFPIRIIYRCYPTPGWK